MPSGEVAAMFVYPSAIATKVPFPNTTCRHSAFTGNVLAVQEAVEVLDTAEETELETELLDVIDDPEYGEGSDSTPSSEHAIIDIAKHKVKAKNRAFFI